MDSLSTKKAQEKNENSRKRLLDAAACIFRDRGYVGTTMRSIADAVNVQPGSIYYYYKSKDDLIEAILDVGIQSVISSIESALKELPANATIRTRIEAVFRAHITAIIENDDYTLATRRVFGQVPEAIRAKNLKLRDFYEAYWQDILVEAQKSGEFRRNANTTFARLFILGALNWTVEWFKPGRGSIDTISREFASFLLDGLIAPEAEATSR